MYHTHPYTKSSVCPCIIGADAIEKAADLFRCANSVASFVEEMERQRVIGKRIFYDENKKTIFICKQYACDSGGGCPENKTLVGERCHCDHYNHSTDHFPLYYCKCGAEFYRPMFAPLFGNDVLIEPYQAVLAGNAECLIAVRIGRKEGGL